LGNFSSPKHKTPERYYLHQFSAQQPDLNYRSEQVRDEMKAVMKFYMDKGVAGFRLDAVG
jgi:glycosidase